MLYLQVQVLKSFFSSLQHCFLACGFSNKKYSSDLVIGVLSSSGGIALPLLWLLALLVLVALAGLVAGAAAPSGHHRSADQRALSTKTGSLQR